MATNRNNQQRGPPNQWYNSGNTAPPSSASRRPARNLENTHYPNRPHNELPEISNYHQDRNQRYQHTDRYIHYTALFCLSMP
jgi:hypothetical protein